MKMKFKITLYQTLFLLYLLFCSNSIAQTFNYPRTLKEPVADTIFGKVVIDNYRWLENVNTKQVKDWLKEQNDFTNDVLSKIPGRESLYEEYNKLDKFATAEIYRVYSESKRYFYKKVVPGDNIGKLYYRQGTNGPERLLFDPGNFINGENNFDFSFVPSKDGKKLALCLSKNGSQVKTIYVLDVDIKKINNEAIHPALDWPDISWSDDNQGFIYTLLQTGDLRSNKLLEDTRVMYHKIGTDAKNDRLILSRLNNPGMNLPGANLFPVSFTEDQKYILALDGMFIAHSTDLLNEHINWDPLVLPDDKARKVVVYNHSAFVLSGKDAAKNQVVAFPVNNRDYSKDKVIIKAGEKTLVDISRSRDYLFIQKTDGINTTIDQYNFKTGKTESVDLPVHNYSFIQPMDINTNECILHVSTWTQPTTRYSYNADTKKSEISSFNSTIKYPGTENFIVEELELKGHDGVMIPLSLFYKKGLKKDGNNIVFMSGYGAYGEPSIPFFKSNYLPLLNRGVIIAETHSRGGGEKGEDWHSAGFKTTKPNTWKDFISTAEYLISNNYTSPRHLIGEGTSAGGILIGRAITERPDLFAVAISNVSLSNMVRGENRPIGERDSGEFGTIKDSVEAMGLIEMDAYLHVKSGIKYPAVVCVGGLNDMYVPFWQPAKFAAALQNNNSSGKTVILIVNNKSGHWSNEKKVTFRSFADMYSFVLWQAGAKGFQPKQNMP